MKASIDPAHQHNRKLDETCHLVQQSGIGSDGKPLGSR